MKTFFISVSIGITVIAVSIFCTHSLVKVSETLCVKNAEITDALENDNFETAKKLCDEMNSHLNEKKTILAVIADHEDLDKIEYGIAEMKGYVECRAKVDAYSKAVSLDVLLRHLPKNYKLRFENVL